MPQLREELGVATCCGKCYSCAKTVLRECLEEGTLKAQPLTFQTAMAA
jgi:bacterioferritin-associated ferredoxin